MRVIARSTLRDYWLHEPGAQTALEAWFAEASRAQWTTPIAIKARYTSASILKDGRVVFNIGGNQYRLVTRINYRLKIIYIRFVGRHEEYDKIDAQTV